jgi:hypothetical protein
MLSVSLCSKVIALKASTGLSIEIVLHEGYSMKIETIQKDRKKIMTNIFLSFGIIKEGETNWSF